MLYVPTPPVPVPKELTDVVEISVPVITVPIPIEPAWTDVMVKTVPEMLPSPEKYELALVPTT